jgi:hypothetical protein
MKKSWVALDLAPMPTSDASWLARYQPWRRRVEGGFWPVVLGIEVVFNTLVTWIDLRRSDPDFPILHPIIWETTSTLVIGALIPLLIAFERRWPLHWTTLRAHLPLHLLASVVFCALHVGGMMALRKGVYAGLDMPYHVHSWAVTFVYEYLKDVRSYIAIVMTVLGYRLLLLRLQGEARVLDAPEAAAGAQEAPPSAPARPERFLVRKLRKEFLIAASDIEWLQAEGNYISLHVNGHDYLLRSTLSDFLDQLDPARFARVHRSYAINLDRVAEIEPLDGGDARLKMKDGSQVPCSRRYREALAA